VAAVADRHGAEPDPVRPALAAGGPDRLQHQLTPPLEVLLDHARVPCPHRAAMIGIADSGQAETDLAAGELACPGCARPLRPWGHARTRSVRDRGQTTLTLRPRRARCGSCRVTHVLLPAVVTDDQRGTYDAIEKRLAPRPSMWETRRW
jgi:Domain of unknown function (DUF6431)